jgi:predicted MFS family arabinose efflux permease
MRIAKPILLVGTPLGVMIGLYEGYRLAGGLVFLMAALIGLVGIAAGTVVATKRRERAAEAAARTGAGSRDPGTPPD